MNTYQWDEVIPTIKKLVYWPQKDQFFKETDICQEWTFFAVESGSFRYGIEDQEGIAQMGDIVLCPPGAAFSRKVLESISFYYFYFSWKLLMDFSENHVTSIEPQFLSVPVGKISIGDIQRLTSTYSYLREFCTKDDSINMYGKNLLLQEIWHLYCWETKKLKREKEERNDPLIATALKIIHEQAYGPFSMKALSAELGLHAVQFTRRFYYITGTNPSDYLSALRLNKARSLLAGTLLTLDEIASECGYDNGLYFSRVFSKKMKVSPSHYRQTHRI